LKNSASLGHRIACDRHAIIGSRFDRLARRAAAIRFRRYSYFSARGERASSDQRVNVIPANVRE
jgi:hypothetical protein